MSPCLIQFPSLSQIISVLFFKKISKTTKPKKQQILEDKVDYHKLKKTVALIIAVVPDVL